MGEKFETNRALFLAAGASRGDPIFSRAALYNFAAPRFPLDPAPAVRPYERDSMPSPEVFYLHIDGEQLGPYTIPQIDHLLNAGLIAEETLYWREGLDQWAPVVTLVPKRVHKRSWGKILAMLVALAAFGLACAFFGPVLVSGWREASQHEYTAKAAYWRAREVVRNRSVPPGYLVNFSSFSKSSVQLQPPGKAAVSLRGQLIDPRGTAQPAVWEVDMRFDEKRAEWTAAPRPEPPLL